VTTSVVALPGAMSSQLLHASRLPSAGMQARRTDAARLAMHARALRRRQRQQVRDGVPIDDRGAPIETELVVRRDVRGQRVTGGQRPRIELHRVAAGRGLDAQ
jgi:hypothetical protein